MFLAGACFLVFNANGREIGSYDSQPTKYAARELLLRGTLGLNYVVGRTPELADRSGFVMARDGRYRSAYSPVPATLAAAVAWPLWTFGLLDIRAPLAPNVIGAVGASLLAALSVACAFLIARRRLPGRGAALVAVGFGLGTGMWSTVSQTLWQHESAILGLSLALVALTRDELRVRDGLLIGIGLALCGMSRPQTAPAIAVLLAGTLARGGWRAAAPAAAIAGACAAFTIALNIAWFGSSFGAAPLLEALHPDIHATTYSFGLSATGLAGLLISPSRGLLIFSPIVLVAGLGLRTAWMESWRSPLGWCAAAAAAQWLFYGSYSVWWAGHTFGPRYMLDVLPLLVPLAAAGLRAVGGPLLRTLAGAALAWSIIVAGTGAFCYPHDRWNTDPVSVDRSHERLWDWRDNQIVRCWDRGISPQNFSIFSREAFRSGGQADPTRAHPLLR